MNTFNISIRPYGIHAILVEWPKKVDEAILDDILQFVNHLKLNCLDLKLWELVPSYNSITLIQRERSIDFFVFKKKIGDWYANKSSALTFDRFLWKLPVCYDEDFAIDLQEVAQKLSISRSELITKHTETEYTVYGIGFLPGFMYLGGLNKELEVPRRASPRLKVAKGAVGLAGKQTGIYPQESPGGWNIIGNCSVSIFNAANENPCFVKVGDKVQFYAIERAEYDLHKIESEVGIYQIEKTLWNA